jgi:hypothetical protein
MLFPPPQIEATEWEVACVENMIEINRRRKEEPYFVDIIPGDARVGKSRAATTTAKFDPFNGPATYSRKYHRAERTAPDFTGKSWSKYRVSYD